VLATRIVGLLTTVLCALPPAYFALMALAFGLGLANAGGIVFGVLLGVVAIGWAVAFWFSTTCAARLAVLIALVPTVLTVASAAYLWIG
jgi:hypothetical protein